MRTTDYTADTADTTSTTGTRGRKGTGGETHRRARTVVRLLPAGMATMVAVDAVLGDRAEYFDAASLLRAWGNVIGGHGIDGQTFLAGQERLGDTAALGVGSALLVVEPAVVLAALVFGGSVLTRLVRARTAA